MREYRLTNALFRDSVDLREYADVIKDKVAQISPNAVVEVYKDKYTVGNISHAESVQIGRLLSKTALADYCIKVEISRLFCGHEVEEN